MKTGIQHFPKRLSRSTINRYFYKLEDSDSPSESLQRRMEPEVVDELVEIVGQNPFERSLTVGIAQLWDG